MSFAYPQQPPSLSQRAGRRTGIAFRCGLTFLVAIWVGWFAELATGGYLMMYGIHPWDLSSWWGVFTSPFLHASWEHILANTVPGTIFAFLIGLSGRRAFWEVTFIVMILGGICVWLFGGVGNNVVGASGLIYGYLAYLVVRGFWNKSWWQLLLGVGLGFSYSGLVYGMLPTVGQNISWQAHLFGALAGVVAAATITSDDEPKQLPSTPTTFGTLPR